MYNSLKVSISVLLLFFFTAAFGQGMKFFEGNWKEALKKAGEEKKLIFVDAYTKWCGPCRRMQKNIFPTKAAGDFYNKNFINVKLDMETQEGMKFGLEYPVGGYPTFFFIDPKGKVVHRHTGSMDTYRFIEMGKRALQLYDKSFDYAKQWEEGKRDYDFVLEYVKSLVRAGKPANKIALQYLRSKPGISKDQKAVLLFEATTTCDSKLFDMMTKKKYLKVIKEIYSTKEIEDKIYDACWNTFLRSIEYDVKELEDEAKAKMKKYNKKRYKEFVNKINLYHAENSNDIDGYIKTVKKIFRSLKDDWQRKLELIEEVSTKFQSNGKIKRLVSELSEKTFKQNPNPKTYLNYVRNLIENEEYDKAQEHVYKALNMAKKANDEETEKVLRRYQFYLQKKLSRKDTGTN